jgi:hypothetical protein
MSERPISEAYERAMNAIASQVAERPFPHGLNEIDAGGWKIACNNGKEPIAWEGTTIDGYCVAAMHNEFVKLASLGPYDGCFAGCSEDSFIDDMNAIAANPQEKLD